MIHYDLIQLTPEWYQMRTGAVTSSRLCDVMAKLVRKDGEAAARANYKKELALARITGRIVDHYVSKEMEWGIENEPIACTEYEFATGNEVTPIGLAQHDLIPYFSASTDGLVGDDGMLEIKCPGSLTHMTTILTGKIDEDYLWQMIGGLACTKRKWCDFVSFDPRFEERKRLFVKRIERDESVERLINAAEREVIQFLIEVADMEKAFKAAGWWEPYCNVADIPLTGR